MESNSKTEFNLQYQIKRRINQNEPSKNDLEFYQRKIRRIQNQYNITIDELNKSKIKIRRLQEYQLKYELLYKQINEIKLDSDRKDSQINQLKSINEHLKLLLQQKAVKDQDYSYERANLMQEIAKWKDKLQQNVQKAKRDLQDERIRCNQTNKRQAQRNKRQYAQKEEDYQFQIRQLKKVIQEKTTVEEVINNRVEKIRSQKDSEILRLTELLQKNKQNYREAMTQKNQEMDRMRQKFQKMINFDVQNLKHNLEDQEEIFSIELNGLREMISLKNDEIQKLLKQIKRQSIDHQQNRNQLLKQISLLKEKMYIVEKESEIQLNNVKDRLISIHRQDSIAVQKKHQEMIDSLKDDNQQLQKYLKEREKMFDNQKKQFQRSIQELSERIKEKDHRIADLADNIKSRGQLNASQMKNLHQSFHKITSQKEDLTSQYQNNIVFLNQQIGKLNASNEIKNGQIKKLHEQIHQLKISYEQHVRQLEYKYKKERKEREEERESERVLKQKMQQNFQNQQRQFKNKERRLQRQKQKQERQKNKIKYMLEEAERDIDRLNKYIKQLDENLKNQFKKNQLNSLDKDGLRRQILSELQKQKVDLQTLKLMEVDQIKKKYEIQLARYTTQNQKLQTNLLNKSLAFQKLQSQFKKLDYNNRNMDKIQKEKLKDYEKKMLTLTQQINLTQNLYKTFLQTKARAENA